MKLRGLLLLVFLPLSLLASQTDVAISPDNVTYQVSSVWHEEGSYYNLELTIYDGDITKTYTVPTTDPTPFGITQNTSPYVLFVNNYLYILWEQSYMDVSQIVLTSFDTQNETFGEVKGLGDIAPKHRIHPIALVTNDEEGSLILHVVWWEYDEYMPAGYPVYCFIPINGEGGAELTERQLITLDEAGGGDCWVDGEATLFLVLKKIALEDHDVLILSPASCFSQVDLVVIDVTESEDPPIDERERNHFPIVGSRLTVSFPSELLSQSDPAFVVASTQAFGYVVQQDDLIYYQYWKNNQWSDFLPMRGIVDLSLAKEALQKVLFSAD